MNRVAILGSGEYATHVASVCGDVASIEVVGLIDGNVPRGVVVDGLTVLGNDDDVVMLHQAGMIDSFFIGIGYEHFDLRGRLYERLIHTIPAATIVHPTAIVNPTASVGKGVLISEGAIIGRNCKVKDNVSIWPGVLMSHDDVVGEHSYIAPRAALAGKVTVGKKCFIGLNSSIRDNVMIGNEVTVGIGCVITKDIADNMVVVGNPQRTIRKRAGGGTGFSQSQSSSVGTTNCMEEEKAA